MLLAVRSINIQIDIPLSIAVWPLFWQEIGAKPLDAHSGKVLLTVATYRNPNETCLLNYSIYLKLSHT